MDRPFTNKNRETPDMDPSTVLSSEHDINVLISKLNIIFFVNE
jgi:hypothetical protein